MVTSPGIPHYDSIRVDRVPMHGREGGLLAELAGVDLGRCPGGDPFGEAIGDDRVGEVISNRGSVWHVNRLSLSDRQERPEAEIGYAFYIAFRVPAGVLVEDGNYRGSHRDKTLPVVASAVNASGCLVGRWRSQEATSLKRAPTTGLISLLIVPAAAAAVEIVR